MTTDNIELAQLSAEQANDLASLQAAAAEQPEFLTQEQIAEQESRASGIAGAELIVKTARRALEALRPDLFAGAGDEAWQGIAEPLAETIEYYGLDIPSVFSHPLAKLGAGLFPVCGFAFVRYQEMKAQAAIETKKPEKVAGPAPAVNEIQKAEPEKPQPDKRKEAAFSFVGPAVPL